MESRAEKHLFLPNAPASAQGARNFARCFEMSQLSIRRYGILV